MAIDKERREALTKSEQLKQKRNEVSDQIAQAKRNKEDASDAIKAMREVGKEIKDLDKEVEDLTQNKSIFYFVYLTSQQIQILLDQMKAITKRFVNGMNQLSLILNQSLTGKLVLN